MPEFQSLSVAEAQLEAGTGKRAQQLREYVQYLEEVDNGRGGRLRPGPGESVTAVRRRLTQAAKWSNKGVTVRRVGDDIFFWPQSASEGQRRRRGRPPKSASPQV